MKKHLIDFPEDNISIESFYDRLRPCYDSIMQFSDRVLVAQMNWNGMLEGAVYGFVEDPEEGWSLDCVSGIRVDLIGNLQKLQSALNR